MGKVTRVVVQKAGINVDELLKKQVRATSAAKPVRTFRVKRSGKDVLVWIAD